MPSAERPPSGSPDSSISTDKDSSSARTSGGEGAAARVPPVVGLAEGEARSRASGNASGLDSSGEGRPAVSEGRVASGCLGKKAWKCSGCSPDYQLVRNDRCRRCRTERPKPECSREERDELSRAGQRPQADTSPAASSGVSPLSGGRGAAGVWSADTGGQERQRDAADRVVSGQGETAVEARRIGRVRCRSTRPPYLCGRESS